MRKNKFLRNLVIFVTCVFLSGGTLEAKLLQLEIYGPGQKKVNMYVAEPMLKTTGAKARGWQEVRDLSLKYLDYLPFIEQVATGDILGGGDPGGYQGMSIDFKKYSLAQVDLLLTAAVEERSQGTGRLELRAYEVFTQRLVLGRAYRVEDREQLPMIIQRFSAELMEALSGNGDFFRTRLAFVRKDGPDKEIWSVSPFGEGLRQITFLTGINLSPSWSGDGAKLVFTHVDGTGHRLGIWDRQTGRSTLHKVQGNSCIGPIFTPQGKVVASLDYQGSPDIYTLNSTFKAEKALVQNWAIDISPSFDSMGEKMAFVSSRFGNPHVFVLNSKDGELKRISYEGKYNTSPSMSPDGKRVAFSRLTDNGHRIIVHDLETGREQQISFGPGNDEEPEWAPDGYFLAFSSNRSGKYRLYITNRFGEDPKAVATGGSEAMSPAWVLER